MIVYHMHAYQGLSFRSLPCQQINLHSSIDWMSQHHWPQSEDCTCTMAFVVLGITHAEMRPHSMST